MALTVPVSSLPVLSQLHPAGLELADIRLRLINQDAIYATPATHQRDVLMPEHQRWEQSLNVAERTIVDTARKLYSALPLSGACYHTSFFLYYYLKMRHGIEGRVEVGFINDGTDPLYASHAWYVYQGRITDLAVSRPFDPSSNWRGPVIILGKEVVAGWKWSYHTETSRRGREAIKNLLTTASANPYDVISVAKQTHIRMSQAARSDEAIRAYLDQSPRGCTYLDLVEKIEANGHTNAA